MEKLNIKHSGSIVNSTRILNFAPLKRSMCTKFLLLAFVFVTIGVSAFAQRGRASKKFQYEMIGLEDVIRRYMVKDGREVYPLEGIYSVTCTVTKRYTSWPWKVDKEKIVMVKENYAKVAILKDWPDANREFIEMSLNQKDVPKYPIVGEFNQWKEGEGYVYKHTEPKGELMSYTFLLDKDGDVFEGVRSEIRRSKTIIFTLTYVKTFPKNVLDTFVDNQ